VFKLSKGKKMDFEIVDALSFMKAVYLNKSLPLPVRIRAAEAALPFEKPKLSATALLHAEGDFADRLQRCIERSERALTNGNGAKVIEHRVSEEGRAVEEGRSEGSRLRRL
jgi:hypothetical protein